MQAYIVLNVGGIQMPINMNVQALNLNSIVGKDKYSTWIEQDILVPDSKPDVMKVIRVEAIPLISDIQVMDNALRISGEITYYILYNSMDGGKTRGISATYPLTQTIAVDYLKKDMMAGVKLNVKNVIFTVPNERKIAIKTELVYEYVITRHSSVNLISGMEDDTIEYKTVQSVFNNVIDIRKDKIDVSEEILLPEEKRGIDEILKVKYSIINTDYKVSYNKILVKGDLDIKILYLAEGLEDAELFETEVPFSGMVEFENISDNYKFNVDYRLNHLDIIVTSERSVQVNADINVIATMFEEKETTYITDFYSTNKELKYDTATVSAIRNTKLIEKSFDIKEVVRFNR